MRFRREVTIDHSEEIDVGGLALGAGALALVRPRLEALAPGERLVVTAREQSLGDDLRGWCSRQGHRFVGSETDPRGGQRHWLERGATGRRVRPDGTGAAGPRVGRLGLDARMALFPPPEPVSARAWQGLRGSELERGAGVRAPQVLRAPGGAPCIPPETGRLYEQALAAQWDPRTAIPWAQVATLAPAQAWALNQIMTFLAENELVALQVPAATVAAVHPVHAELAMLLALHMADEARHLDVFVERARLTGEAPGASSATTGRSLASLREVGDPTEATFLLSVLGEGTFLDLLSFVERHAPDEATAAIARRTRADEARHVHLGLACVRHALATGASSAGTLVAAVERRAARIGSDELPPALQDALVLYAAGGPAPDDVARGHDAFRVLLDDVARGLAKRVAHLGLSPADAERLARLHTPSFM
ncbi:MAG TPA: ferritin-like domain-containing protein [Polyangia bacterium]